MIQAVLAIEDRRFYDHPGVDPIGIVGAVFSNIFGNKAYLRGRQHAHAAARQEHVPDAGEDRRSAR